MLEENIKTKSAFIAIVGRPNVGKSSLLNAMLGQKIAIVSNKPQTTRTRIMGILTRGAIQLVFIDTPGIHQPKTNLGKYMVKSINESVMGVDTCMLVVEAGSKIYAQEFNLINKFKSMNIPAILAINKIDLLRDKSILMKQITELSSYYNFESVIPVSASIKSGVEDVVVELEKLAFESQHFFDSDALTDQPEKVIVSEIIREKMLRLLDKEIPHGIAVIVERLEERKSKDNDDINDIEATIYCERDSHKSIIIGKAGSMLKKIGTYSRQDIENFFGCKVNLKLWVRVKENWRNKENILRTLGYDKNDF